MARSAPLTIGRIGFKHRGYRPLPLVPVGQQFRLVVEQFLARFGGIFEVRPFDDGIDRAGFLAKAAEDALGHVDVIAGGAAAAVVARFGLDRDRLRRADRLAKLTRDAALLAVGIAPQGMLTAEARAQRVLLERIVDRRLGLEEVLQGQPVRLEKLPQGERFDDLGERHFTKSPEGTSIGAQNPTATDSIALPPTLPPATVTEGNNLPDLSSKSKPTK